MTGGPTPAFAAPRLSTPRCPLLTGNYGPPPGFAFEWADPPLMDDPRLEGYNVEERWVRRHAVPGGRLHGRVTV